MPRATTSLSALVMMAVLMAAPQVHAASAAKPAVENIAHHSRFDRFPSPPGPQINLIRKLPPGVWLDLGPPAPDPKWGVARGRDYAGRAPVAPGLGLAFLYGEGVHYWVNEKTGRYMDDFWAYDIMAHAWINFYPGTDTRHPPTLIVNKDGFPATPDGKVKPVGILGHPYQMTTWDPDDRTFLAMETVHDHYGDHLTAVADFMKENKHRLNHDHASPWIYDAKADAWRRYATETPSPQTGFGDVLIYVPTIRKVFFRHKDEVWFYDPAANSWLRMTPAGAPPPFGIEATACYDSKRERIYVGGGNYPIARGRNALWIYDIRSNSWIDPEPKGSPGDNHYGTDHAIMNYDSTNDAVLLFRHGEDTRGVYAYSPSRNEWTTVSHTLPSRWYKDYRTDGSTGFYDAALNAHFFFVAGDSKDNGAILVYRYKAAK